MKFLLILFLGVAVAQVSTFEVGTSDDTESVPIQRVQEVMVPQDQFSNLLQQMVRQFQDSAIGDQSLEELQRWQEEVNTIEKTLSHPVVQSVYRVVKDEKVRDGLLEIAKSDQRKNYFISLLIFMVIWSLFRSFLFHRSKTWTKRLVHGLWTNVALFFILSLVIPRFWFGEVYYDTLSRVASIALSNDSA